MSGVDTAARGLAKRALDNSAQQGLSPSAYGAVGDGVTPDDAAFIALKAALTTAPERTVLLDSKTYALSNSGGLNWSLSNASLVGRGIDRSIIRHINHDIVGGEAIRMGSCENVLFQDLTLHGADGYGTFYAPNGSVTKNIVFNRVKFTSDLQSLIDGHWFGSTNGVRWVCDAGSAQNIWLIDCVFENCGRMGFEFNNHGAGSTVRISNVNIIRPRFINCGQANANGGWSAGMGISLSGYMENILIDRPYFDNIAQTCVELIGASRTKIRDMVVRHDTMGAGLITASNNRPMYGNEIDGLRWVGPHGDDQLAVIPPVATTIRLDNFHQGVLRNCHLNVAGDQALEVGVNYQSDDNLIADNRLISDTGNVVDCSKGSRNTYRGNVFEITAAGGGSHLKFNSVNSVNNLVDGNNFVADSAAPADWSPIQFNDGTAQFTMANRLRGKKLRATGSFVMNSGSAYVSANHELGAAPTRWGVQPTGNTGGKPIHSGVNATIINAAANTGISNDTTIRWWAEVDYGNL